MAACDLEIVMAPEEVSTPRNEPNLLSQLEEMFRMLIKLNMRRKLMKLIYTADSSMNIWILGCSGATQSE